MVFKLTDDVPDSLLDDLPDELQAAIDDTAISFEEYFLLEYLCDNDIQALTDECDRSELEAELDFYSAQIDCITEPLADAGLITIKELPSRYYYMIDIPDQDTDSGPSDDTTHSIPPSDLPTTPAGDFGPAWTFAGSVLSPRGVAVGGYFPTQVVNCYRSPSPRQGGFQSTGTPRDASAVLSSAGSNTQSEPATATPDTSSGTETVDTHSAAHPEFESASQPDSSTLWCSPRHEWDGPAPPNPALFTIAAAALTGFLHYLTVLPSHLALSTFVLFMAAYIVAFGLTIRNVTPPTLSVDLPSIAGQ